MDGSQSQPPHVSGLLIDALRIPAAGLTCLAAITVTLISWINEDHSGVAIDPRGFLVRPWTSITSALVHVDAIHLLFNLAWMWRFGAWIERCVGSWRTLVLYALLAIASAAAEFAWSYGGVGLSGVVYGLFGLLWMRRRFDPDAARLLDRYTVILFVGWFFVCVLLTLSNVYPVANMAHLAGALAGAGIGWAWNREGLRRRVAVVVLCTCFVLVLEAATVGRYLTNSGPGLSLTYALRGEAAMQRKNYADGLSLCRRAVEQDPTSGFAQWHLGTAQVMTGSEILGLASLREAARLGVRTDTPERVWLECVNVRAFECSAREEWTAVDQLANEMLRIDEKHINAWFWIGQAASRAGRMPDACTAFERVFDLDPEAPSSKENQVWAKLTRARLAYAARDFERALREIETGLDLAPEDAPLLALKQEIVGKPASGR